jgi:hypothetical protein
MENKKLITWKDADQNLCRIAAYILNEAAQGIRKGSAGRQDAYPTRDGEGAPRGYAEDDDSTRSVFSIGTQDATGANPSSAYRGNWWEFGETDNDDILGKEEMIEWIDSSPMEEYQEGEIGLIQLFTEQGKQMMNFLSWVETNVMGVASTAGWPGFSPQCWWSFQNMVKQRLELARMELKENLYASGTKRAEKTKEKKSRNYGKRFSFSKYGRQPER